MLNYSGIPVEWHITFTLTLTKFILRPVVGANITGISGE